MGARLLNFAEVWAQRGVDDWSLSILRKGYLIPFREKPPLTTTPRELSARYKDPVRRQALLLAVDQMLAKAAKEPVQDLHSRGFTIGLFWFRKLRGVGDQCWT